MDKKVIKILVQNVRGMRDKGKRKQLFTLFRKDAADLVLLQETHSAPADEVEWGLEWGDPSSTPMTLIWPGVFVS